MLNKLDPPLEKNLAPGKATKAKRTTSLKHEVRETVEAVVVAFVLAFLFRTFEAEAFVIPTGSMAPTLRGQHKDLECDKCGFPYIVSASSESLDGIRFNSRVDREDYIRDTMLQSSVCPNCRHVMALTENGKPLYKTYTGDRILVAKFPYSLHEPERWDVVVFRYPEGAKQNYIKRLVGLPNETILLRDGDVHVRRAGEDHFEIARKPAWKARAMLQDVYNNDYQPAEWQKNGWPARWQPTQSDTTAELPPEANWQASDDRREYTVAAPIGGEKWLRYHHFVPSNHDWKRLEAGPLSPRERQEVSGELITDMYGYNTEVASDPRRSRDVDHLGLHWVGDLAVEFELQVSSDAGEVVLELIEGDDVHQCRIDVATGEALLQSSGPEAFSPRARTAIKGPGIHKVMFANLDNQLFLWIDGDEVVFDTSTEFVSTGSSRPSVQDLSPVGIGAKGVTATVRHLRVLRDIYYIATAHGRGRGDLITEHAQGGLANSDIAGRHKSLTEPQQWAYTAQEVEFPLDADQFLMLGDNSPKSKDSRLWDNEQFVRRDLLVGKALYVYWPHALDDKAPMFPNFPLMRFVR